MPDHHDLGQTPPPAPGAEAAISRGWRPFSTMEPTVARSAVLGGPNAAPQTMASYHGPYRAYRIWRAVRACLPLPKLTQFLPVAIFSDQASRASTVSREWSA